MMLGAKLRAPALVFFGLILVLGLVAEGEGFGAGAVAQILSKLFKMAKTVGAGFAGHTWNVVSFKLVEAGWNGLMNVIFPKDDKVTDTMNEILERFDEVEDLVTTTTIQTIDTVSSNLMRISVLARNFEQIDAFLSYLQEQMAKMHRYRHINATATMWRDFANSVISKSNQHSVINQMEDVYKLVADTSGVMAQSFLTSLIEYYHRTKDNQRCELVTSPQQTFIEFLRKLYTAETKTFVLVAFAYQMLSAIDGRAKYDTELEIHTEFFFTRSARFDALIGEHAGKLSRDFFVCNPAVNEATAFQMNKFMYGYVAVEKDVAGWCGGECGYLNEPRGLKSLGEEGHRKCVGTVQGCRSTDSKNFEFCYSKNDEQSYFYEFMKNDVIKAGKKEMCGKADNPLIKKYAYVEGVYKCDYCVCTCASEDDETHRFLSLLPQMSNIFENKVIVGVKLTKYQSKLVSLQIKEAPLQPYGYVDETQAEWRELDPMLLPNDYWNYPGYHQLSAKVRAMRMTQLEGPEHSVLTGIKFVVKDEVPEIAIRFTYFNFTSGVMQPNKSYWMTERHEDPKPIDYQGLIEPAGCVTMFPDTKSGQRVLFGTTGWLADGGSKVIPFFDSQPVAPSRPLALSGAGLVHKGADKCGGLIAPVVTTLPLKYFVTADMDQPKNKDPF